jgi:hypothetical protein
MKSGSDEEKEAFLACRGYEIISFIGTFIQKNNGPMLSEDGKTGGIILLGCSYGNYPVISALSQVDSPSPDDCKLLQSHLKSIILYGKKL